MNFGDVVGVVFGVVFGILNFVNFLVVWLGGLVGLYFD